MPQLSVILFLIFPFFLFSQSTPTDGNKISKDLLLEDLQLLERHLRLYHPGLYKYSTEAEFDEVFDTIESQIGQPMSAIDFYRLIAPLQKTIANGHTEIDVPENFREAARQNLPRFPFSFYYDNSDLWITRNLSLNKAFPIPSKLKRINGQDALTVMKFMADRMTRDGYNQTLPNHNASRLFSLFYAYYIDTPKEFDIVIETQEGKEMSYSIEGITLTQMRKFRSERYGKPDPNFWSDKSIPASTLSIERKVATMNVRTFDTKTAKKRGQPFKKWMDESFAKINQAGVEHLILDLRDNGGGDPMPTVELFSHLYDKSFTFYREVTSNTKKFKEGKYYKFPIWLLNLRALIKIRKEKDKYIVRGIDGIKEAKPAKDIFKGKLYVLTNANSFSATGEMSAIIKENTAAIFIGEEPGGNPNQNTSGVMLPMVLPNSQVQVTMPIILWKMNVNFPNTGFGVVPDYPIKNSIDDVMNKTDRVMEFTMELITGEN